MTDYIDRQAAIDAVMALMPSLTTADGTGQFDAEIYREQELVVDIGQVLNDLPPVEVEPVKHGRWIPVSERLPEEDTEVLISYRYKEGEGDTSHVDIDITTYGQMYFGGNKVGNNKHWRAPFEYFYSNYEVIAWMPLPEPYTEEGEDE